MTKSWLDPSVHVAQLGARAKEAALDLRMASTDAKNTALFAAAQTLRAATDALVAANARDVDSVRATKPERFIDRLTLNAERIEGMARALEDIAKLPDPVGRLLARFDRPNGLMIERVAVPIGVIGMIYESRPNVGSDASALCLKSGNAVIPRGGRGLTELVRDNAKVPTLLHLDGNCHIYVHADADLEKAIPVIRNAKLRRTGICGAAESLVVDQAIANRALPLIADTMPDCELRGDREAVAIDARVKLANDDDFDTEFLDAVVSIKVVADADEAMAWVAQHSSGHTDAILTENESVARRFLAQIDSAIVMHNASTQFADGGEFGMGAEIGIATGKMHARGPVGLEQLTSFKYIVLGNGQTRP